MKKINLVLAIVALGIFAIARNATAYPTLDEILPPGAPAVTASDQSWVQLTDTDGTTDDIVATLLFEDSSCCLINKFGIYKFNGVGVYPLPSQMLQLLTGPDDPYTSVTVQFNLSTGIATNLTTAEFADIGTVFGFYLINPGNELVKGGTFYTDELLNLDSKEHGLLFDTYGETGIVGNPNVVVAFEDWTDFNYNDLVVGVTDVSIIPEPVTIALLGLGGLALLRKRRA